MRMRCLFLLLLVCQPALAMQPMSDSELMTISGREGIDVELELRANADESGQPLNPLCATDLAQTDCRLALQFADRDGEWIVLKGFYGRLVFPSIRLDATETPLAPTAYEDLSRYLNESGTPLLASPHGIAALELTFPEDIEIWNLTITGGSVEYDNDPAAVDPSGPGFLNNVYGAAVGVKISNSVANQPATIKAEGRAVIYGF